MQRARAPGAFTHGAPPPLTTRGRTELAAEEAASGCIDRADDRMIEGINVTIGWLKNKTSI